MALPEKTKIWSAIKASLADINKSGSNGIEVLMWSQDKGLDEVKQKLKEIKLKAKHEAMKNTEIQEETVQSLETSS